MQALAIFAALLNAAAPVTTLVGSGPAARIYPLELPQGCALPAIAIEAEADAPLPTIDANAGYGMRSVQVSVHLLAKTATDLAALQIAVEQACQFQRGTVATYSVASIGAPTVGAPETDSGKLIWYLPLTFPLTYRR